MDIPRARCGPARYHGRTADALAQGADEGRGKLLTSLIKAGLLDSLTIYTVPVMAGKGIGFVGETSGSLWKLSESRVLDNGVVCSTYLFGGNI